MGIVERSKMLAMRVAAGLIVAFAIATAVATVGAALAFFWWLDHVRFVY